jgi:hypothetical protein
VCALAKLNMPPVGSLRDTLWSAAKRMTFSMSPLEPTKPFSALAELKMPPAVSLRGAL